MANFSQTGSYSRIFTVFIRRQKEATEEESERSYKVN